MSLTRPSVAWKVDRAYRLIGKNPKTIVFVTPLLRPREIKLATAARSVGWKVVLLYKQTTPFAPPDGVFDVAIMLPDEAALHRVAKILEPRLCHVFSGAVDEAVLAFCRNKPSRIIIDLNDVFCPSLFNYLQERFEPTRECLSLADALCCRDLQPKFAERYDGFKLPAQILMFPEYPWIDGPSAPGAVAKQDPEGVHVVSVGTFTLEKQGMHDSAHLRIARLMTEQKIHFHIYPHWFYRDAAGSVFRFNQKQDFSDFIELEKETPYLHLHNSLPVEELARVLPQYDFGLISGGCNALGQKLDFLTERYMHGCYSGRISDFLDARLPILINSEVAFNTWLLARYGVRIDLKGLLEDGFREKLLAIKHDPAQRALVEEACIRLDLRRQAKRLDTFYERLVADRPPGQLRVPIWMRGLKRAPVIGSRLATIIETAQRVRPMREQLAELGGQHQALAAALEEQRRASAAQLDALNEEKRVLIEEVRAQRLELGLEQERLDVLKQENAQLQRQLLTEAAGRAEDSAQFQALLEQETALRRQLDTALETQAAAQKESLAKLRSLLDEERTLRQQLNDRLETRAAELAELQAAHASLQRKLEAENAAHHKTQSEYAALHQEAAQLRGRLNEEISDLRTAQASLQREMEIEVAAHHRTKTEQAALREEAAQLRAAHASLQRETEAEVAAHHRTKTEQAALREEAAQLRAAQASLQRETEAEVAAHHQTKTEQAALREEAAQLRAAQASLQSKLKADVAAHNKTKREHAALREEVTQLRGRLNEETFEHRHTAGRLVELQETDARRNEQVMARIEALGGQLARAAILSEENAALLRRAAELEKLRADETAQHEVARNELQAKINGLRQELMLGGTQIDHIAGLLNWPEISDAVARNYGHNELLRIMSIFGRHELMQGGERNHLSAAWEVINRKTLDQLLVHGYRNFKRTVGLSYFTFPLQAGDPQITALEGLVGDAEKAQAWQSAEAEGDDPDFSLTPQAHFRYALFLLWHYLRGIDRQNVLARLSEPAEGNAVTVGVDGCRVSQDLANSVVEYYAMAEHVDFNRCKTVLEVGAGYGRDAFVIATLHPDICYILVDIPPAIYVAERYLASVFPDRKISPVREFERFEDVREDFEGASFIFLLPHQLEKLPPGFVDLTLNISSFGEMTVKEVDRYFSEIDRLTTAFFYTKQWKQSKNPFDHLVLTENDYPVRPGWRPLYRRECAVQREFFEALYDVTGRE